MYIHIHFFFRYLNHYLIPAVKFSYYAGILTYQSTKNVYDFHTHCKTFLNTDGQGWQKPITNFSNFNNKIQSINIVNLNNIHDTSSIYNSNDKNDLDTNENNLATPCANLIMNNNDNSDETTIDHHNQLIISLPKLENENSIELANIWLPFKRRNYFNLQLKSSAFILVRYFVALTKCHQFEGIPQNKFNHNFKIWLSENILPFIYDNKFYPGLGAILRIWETISSDTENLINDSNINNNNNDQSYQNIQEKVNDINSKETESGFFKRFFSSSSKFYNNINDDEKQQNEINEKEKIKYIIMIIVLIVVGFIIVIIVTILLKRRKTQRQVKRKEKPNSKQNLNESKRRRSEPKKKKSSSIFGCCINKSNDDEEIELGENSSSVMSINNGKPINNKYNKNGNIIL